MSLMNTINGKEFRSLREGVHWLNEYWNKKVKSLGSYQLLFEAIVFSNCGFRYN